MLSLRLGEWLLVETMPTAVTATILGSQCNSLLQLELVAPSVGMAGPNIAALAALTRLAHLDVRLDQLQSILLCVSVDMCQFTAGQDITTLPRQMPLRAIYREARTEGCAQEEAATQRILSLAPSRLCLCVSLCTYGAHSLGFPHPLCGQP